MDSVDPTSPPSRGAPETAPAATTPALDDQKTILSDLSGKSAPAAALERTIVSDLSGAPVMTSVGIQDTQMTQLNSQGAVPGQATGITQLHIETDPARSAAGTHRGEEWGDFRIGELLGRGGMGAVYKGLQLSLDRPVAIKVLPQELSLNENFRSRFQLEAKAVARLSSPNVIQVYAAGVHLGKHYFAMEYVEGKDLSVRMRSGFKPTPNEALELILQAARGLAAAGELGIVHRDIKPANMMLTSRGVLKLMDFGLVKIASEDHSMTMSGTIMGTVSYFSPEQGRGDRCDQRTDIYALGVVFYELLSGLLPFTGGDATSIIYQHIHSEPKPLKEINPAIPDGFQAVVRKCMAKKAEDRYQDASQLVQDLVNLSQGKAPQLEFATTSGSPHVPAATTPGRRWRPMAIAAVVLIAAGVALAVIARNRGAPNPSVATSDPAIPHASAPPAVDAVPATTSVLPAVVASPVSPPPADPTPVGVTVPDPDSAMSLLRAGKFEDARQLADRILQTAPGNPAWMQVSKAIDAAHGEHALVQVRQAIAGNDVQGAVVALSQAQLLLGETPAVQQQEQLVAALQLKRKQRDERLATAENLFANGDIAKAESQLSALDAEQPGDGAVTNLLARVHAAATKAAQISSAASEQLRNADQAMAQKDYDAALLSYTAVKQLDPTSVAASTGLDRIAKIKGMISDERTVFDKSLSAGDLVAASASLAKIRDLAPGSPTLAVAENQLSTAKMSSERSQRENEERDAKLTADAQQLLKRLDDPKESLPELEKLASALLSNMDPGRSDRVLIERRLEDRRSSEQFTSELVKLDAGVLRGDATVIRQLVNDGAFADALAQMKNFQGLVFETRLLQFQRHDRDATATVTIRNAMALAPERLLNYTYDLRRDTEAGWQIVAAHLQQ